MQKNSYVYVLALLAALLVVYGCERIGISKMRLCKHQYALCTSASCVPLPGAPDTAVCTCAVEEGSSMATVPCNQLQPHTDERGVRTVFSTFSYKQFSEGKRVLQCPAGTPWTWCLNKQCTVDLADPKKAICTCDVVRSDEPWITFGGDCDPATCTTAYWSGASMKDFASGNTFMTKKLKLKASPVKWCPIKS